ncbi:hypothetical protein FN846DRAFT_474157 [Sphaerosporella brunnea]|uniref:Uncharacterized protein n=1 Tax=Sphaerosporella brunnea TaxID=1250544 RepID=A0A5J5EFD1_9PEZI|nr:hypothetical protein FN846DRAFT_474157 [Sphaerosporella brunnea]
MASMKNSSSATTNNNNNNNNNNNTNTNKQKKPTPPKLITKFDSRPIELQPIAEAANGTGSPSELSPTSSSLLRLLPSGIVSKFSSPTGLSPLSPSVYTPCSFSWGSRVASSIWSRSSVSSPADGRTSPWEWKFPQAAAPQAQLALDGVGGQFVEEEEVVEGEDKRLHASLTPVTPRIFINEHEWRSVSDSHSACEAAVEEASVEVAELPATGLEAVELPVQELEDVELDSSDSSLYRMPVRQVGVQTSAVQQPEGSFPSSSQDYDVTRPRIGRGRVGSISRIKSFIQRLHSRLENEVPPPSEETPECEDTETGYGIRECKAQVLYM